MQLLFDLRAARLSGLLGRRGFRELSAPNELTFLLFLQKVGSHLASDPSVFGDDADHAGPSSYLLVEVLQLFGAPDLASMLWVKARHARIFLLTCFITAAAVDKYLVSILIT